MLNHQAGHENRSTSLGTTATRDLYRRRARRYDQAVRLYGLIGIRLRHLRRRAVDALALRPGDTVVDLACGTGLNFEFLRRAVGPTGRVVGVDLTDAMLLQARRRVAAKGWHNVDLVQADIARYELPADLGGVISTLAITLVPEFDEVIERASAALRPNARLAILDLKRPQHWPEWLVRLAVWVNKPYGVSLALADRHPWESVQRALHEVLHEEFLFGALYLSVGERRAGTTGPLP